MLVGTSAAEGFWFKSLHEYTEGLTSTNAFGTVGREIGVYNGLRKESCSLWRRMMPRTSDICYCGEQ